MPLKPASTFIPSRSPIVSQDGNATFPFIKILQDWDTRISNGLSPTGGITGDIQPTVHISGRGEIGTILQFIDDGGQVLAGGINFARDYINKDTDHIADGIGSPLAGGKVAFEALVDSNPTAGQTIRYDGTEWQAVAIAESQPVTAHEWIDSYDDATGTFTASQPTVADVVGAAPLASPTFTGTVTTPALADTGLTSGHLVAAGGGGLLGNGPLASLFPVFNLGNSASPTPARVVVGVSTLAAGTFTETFATPFSAGQVYALAFVISGNSPGTAAPTVWVQSANTTSLTVACSSAVATNQVFWIAIGNP